MIAKKDKIRQGVLAHMDLFCTEPPKLTFPFAEKIVILEVSDVKNPQSISINQRKNGMLKHHYVVTVTWIKCEMNMMLILNHHV